MFLLKLDQAGNVSWARQFSNEEEGLDFHNVPKIAVDQSGNVLLTGAFFRAGDFDPGAGTTILTPKGKRDSWVSKLDSSGNLLWLRQISGIDTVTATRVSVDLSGKVLVAGQFNRTADFDPGPGTSNFSAQGQPGFGASSSRDGDDAFVVKLTPSGEFEWARTFGGRQTRDGVSDLVVDQEANIVIAGQADSSADLDPGDDKFVLERPTGGYVLKLNSAGGFMWAKGIVADTAWPTLALDPLGAIHVSGSFLGTRDLDPGSSVQAFTSRGVDTYMMKLDGSGSLVWIGVVSGPTADPQPRIGVDSAGNVFAFGRFVATVDFDPGEGVSSLTSRGGDRPDLADLYISRLNSAGSLVWVRQFNGISRQISTALAVDQLGNSYTVSAIVGLVDMDFGLGACVLGNRTSQEVSLLISKFNSLGSNL